MRNTRLCVFVLCIVITGSVSVETVLANQDRYAAEGASGRNVRAGSVELDDEVKEAASAVLQMYLKNTPKPMTEEQQEDAIRRGVEAGLNKTRQEGKEITLETLRDLESYLRNILNRSQYLP